ncbi:hypothetical protein IWW56_004141, partial [Coemansia sp. RSA 2131]
MDTNGTANGYTSTAGMDANDYTSAADVDANGTANRTTNGTASVTNRTTGAAGMTANMTTDGTANRTASTTISVTTGPNTVGHCVLVDPGRQDLLFAMCEDSSIAEKKVHWYTKCQQHVETKQTKYRKILQQVKTADVAADEHTLGAGSCIKPDLDLYKVYLCARAQVAAKLTWFYNYTMSCQRDGTTMPE